MFIGCSLNYFRDLDVEMELRLLIGLIFFDTELYELSISILDKNLVSYIV